MLQHKAIFATRSTRWTCIYTYRHRRVKNENTNSFLVSASAIWINDVYSTKSWEFACSFSAMHRRHIRTITFAIRPCVSLLVKFLALIFTNTRANFKDIANNLINLCELDFLPKYCLLESESEQRSRFKNAKHCRLQTPFHSFCFSRLLLEAIPLIELFDFEHVSPWTFSNLFIDELLTSDQRALTFTKDWEPSPEFDHLSKRAIKLFPALIFQEVKVKWRQCEFFVFNWEWWMWCDRTCQWWRCRWNWHDQMPKVNSCFFDVIRPFK